MVLGSLPRWPYLSRGVGQGDLHRSPPTSTIMWFCDTSESHAMDLPGFSMPGLRILVWENRTIFLFYPGMLRSGEFEDTCWLTGCKSQAVLLSLSPKEAYRHKSTWHKCWGRAVHSACPVLMYQKEVTAIEQIPLPYKDQRDGMW